MKFQVMSDLHLEFCAGLPQLKKFEHVQGTDALILAGDIGKVSDTHEAFKDWPVPVIYVLGNHEFYGGTYEDVRELGRLLTTDHFRVLDPGVTTIGNVRIIGATLWTDCNANGNVPVGKLFTGQLNDYRYTLGRDVKFTPDFTVEECERQLTFIKEAFAEPFEGETLIVTHHAPSMKSTAPMYMGSPHNTGFCSNFDDVVNELGSFWIHGHMHNSADYRIGDGYVIANPRGYPRRLANAIIFENPDFDPLLVLEV